MRKIIVLGADESALALIRKALISDDYIIYTEDDIEDLGAEVPRPEVDGAILKMAQEQLEENLLKRVLVVGGGCRVSTRHRQMLMAHAVSISLSCGPHLEPEIFKLDMREILALSHKYEARSFNSNKGKACAATLRLKQFNTRVKPFPRKYKHLMPRSSC
tara:strand:- start:91414 stop:91893 length:480 start_codon:yes stop_codon:yes gene_type:complete